MRFRVLFFFLASLFAGCVSVDNCDDNSDSELVARFKTIKEEVISDSSVTALTLYGIREGMADSLIYDSLSTSGFIVPLNPHLAYSRFVIMLGEQADTLTIHHRQELYLVSYTCGFAKLFTIENLEYGTTFITSDTIISTMVDAAYEEDEEHIWLYL